MLTRFTPAVRSVVARAYKRAVREGSAEISETDLFEALIEDEEGAVLLDAVAGDEVRARVVAEIDQARSGGGLTAMETDALAKLGVDVGALVRRIEEQVGANTLAGPRVGPQSQWQAPLMSGTVLRILEEAERQVAMVGVRSLGIEHLTLAIVLTPSLLSESVARRGITVESVKHSVAVQRQRGAHR